MGSCAGCKPVIAAASGPGRALALLLGLLLGRLPWLLLPGRLLLLLLVTGLAWLLAGLLRVHLVLRVALLLHGKRLLQGERQGRWACPTDRGELSGFTIAAFGSHFVSVGLTDFP